MSTDASDLRADRFAEIGAAIQRGVGIIIDRWSLRAVNEQPQAKRVHRVALLDHLPKFLQELGLGLAESGDKFCIPQGELASTHGEQRWHAGWSLSELIRDYQMLRLVILEYLDETLERPLFVREVMAVGLALDDAIEISGVRYTEHCNAEFQRQNEGLQKADRRKNEFLATLAHELRNPLAPLRNCLDVLRLKDADVENIQQAQEIMDRQLQQMSRLVDDLLDMSRIALGKLILRKERVKLKSILADAMQTVNPLSDARQHALTLTMPDESIWVNGDPARLVQVFVNLLNNAVKYTPPRGRLGVIVSRDTDQAIVKVCDSGVGIPAEMLSQIFDLYTQIDLGPDRSQEGLGIGLSLVRQLVQLHGGTITVHSDGPNQGSEFVVQLPLAPIDLHAPLSGAVGRPSEPAAPCRILLVEDNVDARRSLALLLKLVGNQVEVVENGRSAIEAVAERVPDVALVDIGLPDVDGYAVARQIRQIHGNAVFLVALTGYSQPEDRQRAHDAGFDTHLIKPVDFKILRKLLADFVARRQADPTPESRRPSSDQPSELN